MTLLCTCVGLTLGRCCCLYLPASIIVMYSIVTSLKRWVLLNYLPVCWVCFCFVVWSWELMSRVCCLSEGFWEYIVVPSACFSVSYSEYYLFVHAVYGDYFTAFTNNAVFIHTWYWYWIPVCSYSVRRCVLAWGIMRTCGSADTPTGKMRIKNADNICGLMGKMQICGRIEIKAFAWSSPLLRP